MRRRISWPSFGLKPIWILLCFPFVIPFLILLYLGLIVTRACWSIHWGFRNDLIELLDALVSSTSPRNSIQLLPNLMRRLERKNIISRGESGNFYANIPLIYEAAGCSGGDSSSRNGGGGGGAGCGGGCAGG
jgi:hypothetical protein